MTQSSSLIVRVERPGQALGTAMNEIRSWLDSHKIQPVDFRLGASNPGTVALEIKFKRENEAHLFERTFTLAAVAAGDRREDELVEGGLR